MPLERRTVSLHALPLLGLDTAHTLEKGRGLNLTVGGRERCEENAPALDEARDGLARYDGEASGVVGDEG